MFLGVTDMILGMPYTDDERQRIAEKVRRARIDKKLDKEPAARVAEVSSITWKRIEDGESVRDASLGKVLDSLGLSPVHELLQDAAGEPASATPVSPSMGARHVLNHTWGAAETFTQELMAVDPPMPLRRAADVLVSIFGLQLADHLIKFDLPIEERDQLLAELYRRRDAVTNQIGAEHDLETAAEPAASAQGRQAQEEPLDDATKTPMGDLAGDKRGAAHDGAEHG